MYFTSQEVEVVVEVSVSEETRFDDTLTFGAELWSGLGKSSDMVTWTVASSMLWLTIMVQFTQWLFYRKFRAILWRAGPICLRLEFHAFTAESAYSIVLETSPDCE